MLLLSLSVLSLLLFRLSLILSMLSITVDVSTAAVVCC